MSSEEAKPHPSIYLILELIMGYDLKTAMNILALNKYTWNNEFLWRIAMQLELPGRTYFHYYCMVSAASPKLGIPKGSPTKVGLPPDYTPHKCFLNPAKSDSESRIQYLRSLGAKIKFPDMYIMDAVQKGCHSFTSILLSEGADVNEDDRSGSLILHALNKKDPLMFIILIDAGADLDYEAWTGETVLMHLFETDHSVDPVESYPKDNIFNDILYDPDNKYNWAMLYYSLNGNLRLLKKCIELGASCKFVDVNGYSALDNALYCEDFEMSEFLQGIFSTNNM